MKGKSSETQYPKYPSLYEQDEDDYDESVLKEKEKRGRWSQRLARAHYRDCGLSPGVRLTGEKIE